MKISMACCALLLAAAHAATPAQTVGRGDRAALDRATSSVLAALRRNGGRALGSLVDARRGLTVYYLFPDNRRAYSTASWRRAVASRAKITWLKPMQGDGGMRPAVRMTHGEFFGTLRRIDWRRAKRSYDGSKPVTYRTLDVADLKRRHPGVRFVDLVVTNPQIPETSEFDSALVLGFVRGKGGRGYRLSVVGYDHWKD